MMTVDELDAELRRVGAIDEPADEDEECDVGPSERDRRIESDAHERLLKLILAGGKVETGGRSLYESAGDEIVRLHGALAAKIDELQQAKEALEQARTRVDDLRGALDVLRREANDVRNELGAKPGETLREAARRVADELMREIAGGSALPLSGAPATPHPLDVDARDRRKSETFRALDAAGVPFGEAMAAASAAAREQAGLSAEDAETLRGAGWLDRDGAWYAPAYDLAVPGGLESLRRSAHIIRAQRKPAPARGTPGKATGAEAAEAGPGSVAEEQGAAQGAVGHGPEFRAVADGPTARDAVAGMLLRAGFGTSARDVVDGARIAGVADELKNYPRNPAAAACIAALEALDRGDLCGARDHVGLAAVITRVSGERDEFRRERDEARDDLERCRRALDKCSSRRVERERERDEARAEAAALREEASRLRVERDDLARAAPAWRDADASPLRPAEDIAREYVTRVVTAGGGQIAVMLRGLDRSPDVEPFAAGVAAVAALIERSRAEGKRAPVEARKENNGSVSTGAEADVSRSFEASRSQAVRLPVLPEDREPAPAQAGVAPAGESEAARGDADAQVSGMRIEKREDGEWLVGVPIDINDCPEQRDGWECHYHLNGEHVATHYVDFADDGAERIVARWPIAPPQDEPPVKPWNTCPKCGNHVDVDETIDGSERRCLGCRTWLVCVAMEDGAWRLCDTSDDDLLTGWDGATKLEMSWPREADPDALALAAAQLVSAPGALRGDVQVLHAAAAGIRLAAPKDSDPRAVLATVAELLGLPSEEERIAQTEAIASAKGADVGHAAGIREGERRARHVEPTAAAPDREALGREVRRVWVAWAHEQPHPKGSWLLPWESLAEPDREVDRRIGERLFTMGAAAERARQQPADVALYPAPDAPGQWIAHHVKRDLVTQGDSEPHALRMLAKAIEMMDGAPEQPRDIAGRIREMARKLTDDGRAAADDAAGMPLIRMGLVLEQTADELEAIARECEPERER